MIQKNQIQEMPVEEDSANPAPVGDPNEKLISKLARYSMIAKHVKQKCNM
jgi:hypothetical protein